MAEALHGIDIAMLRRPVLAQSDHANEINVSVVAINLPCPS